MLNSVRWIGLRSLIRKVHWLKALAAATTIVSLGPSSSSDAKSTAYDTDIVDERRASGRLTLKTDVIDESSNIRKNSGSFEVFAPGRNFTSSTAPTPMIVHTYTRAATGRDFTRRPTRPCVVLSRQLRFCRAFRVAVRGRSTRQTISR